MNKTTELRTQRARAWEQAKAFLDSHRNEKGILSAEDTAAYEKMEKEIVDLGHEIDRQERADALERELNASTAGSATNITADVESMTSYESAAGYGNHKWIGLLITTGFPFIVGMKLNDTILTQTDADETTRHSGIAGDLVLYLPRILAKCTPL